MKRKLLRWNGEQLLVKACPFCGCVNGVDTHDTRDIREDDDIPDENNYVAICCNFNKGGCGASGGFAPNLAAAIVKWNRRVSQ